MGGLLSQLIHTKKRDINTTTTSNLQEISDKDIENVVKLAKNEAIDVIKEFGMPVKEGKSY